MAIADLVESTADADVLEGQARALDARAEMFRDQARRLNREAADLRLEAGRIRRDGERVAILNQHPKRRGQEDVGFLAAVADAVEDMGQGTSTDLAERLHTTQQRVRDALLRLEGMGRVQRTGLARGTRWFPACPDETPDLAPTSPTPVRHRNLEAVIRDAARKLEAFTFEDLAEALPDVSEQSLRRWLPTLEAKGMLYAEKVGTRKLYEYAKPTDAGPARRPAEAPPEVLVAREHGARLAKRDANLTSGRRVRTGNKRSDEAIRKAQKAGASARIKRNQHVEVVTPDGQRVGLALTPSKGSARADRDKLRKAGLDV